MPIEKKVKLYTLDELRKLAENDPQFERAYDHALSNVQESGLLDFWYDPTVQAIKDELRDVVWVEHIYFDLYYRWVALHGDFEWNFKNDVFLKALDRLEENGLFVPFVETVRQVGQYTDEVSGLLRDGNNKQSISELSFYNAKDEGRACDLVIWAFHELNAKILERLTDEYEYVYSDEHLIETANLHELLFFEDGRVY